MYAPFLQLSSTVCILLITLWQVPSLAPRQLRLLAAASQPQTDNRAVGHSSASTVQVLDN
jgi:hypothetical protein